MATIHVKTGESEPEEYIDTDGQDRASDGPPASTGAGGGGRWRTKAPPSSGLLSFYDRLRVRIVDFVDERGGRLGKKTAEALLLVPDVFILLVRLSLDREVPRETRMMIASVLAYFVLPFDVLPEAFAGPVGFLDDLILAVVVLSKVFDRELEPFVARYWSGSQDLRRVIADVLETAQALVGANVYDRIFQALEKRGIDAEDVKRAGGVKGEGGVERPAPGS